MTKTKTTTVRASSLRRAVSTLKRAGFIHEAQATPEGDYVEMKVIVPSDLTMPKKRIRKPKILLLIPLIFLFSCGKDSTTKHQPVRDTTLIRIYQPL